MARLTMTAFVTLDGVMQAPGGPQEDVSGGFQHGGWVVPYFDQAFGEFMTAVFSRPIAFLLGRGTYQIWRHGLVDELNLLTFRVVLGSGKRLFEGGGAAPAAFELTSSQVLSTGVVLTRHRLVGRPSYGQVPPPG